MPSIAPRHRYYLPSDHGLFGRVRKRLSLHRPVPRFPRVVQIQTRSGCNANCRFCPYGETVQIVPKGRMEDALFARVAAECGRHRVKRISPYLMNDPFVDPHLAGRIAVLNRLAPRSKICVTTNGGLMKPDVVADLLDKTKIHRIYVSVQGIDKESYAETMRGPDLDSVIRHVEFLGEEIRRRGLARPKLTVTMVRTGLIDADRAIAFWNARGIEAKATRLENRGGNIEVNAGGASTDSLAIGPMRQFIDCSRLMRQAFVLHDGRVVLCCTDYYQTMVLGDLNRSSLFEIWNSDRATTIRRDFLGGDLSRNPLCEQCTIASRQS